jgi:hypothetical protein
MFRRRIRRLLVLTAAAGGVAAWRQRQLAANQRRYDLP